MQTRYKPAKGCLFYQIIKINTSNFIYDKIGELLPRPDMLGILHYLVDFKIICKFSFICRYAILCKNLCLFANCVLKNDKIACLWFLELLSDSSDYCK